MQLLNKRMVLVMGRPGVGKTRLAGTFPDPYFLDLENGAATAFPGIDETRRLPVATDAGTLKSVKAIVGKMQNKELKDGALWTDEGTPVRTLVIDSIDAIQQAVIDFTILKGRRFKMQQGDWGDLLNMIRPLMLMFRSLPCHVVVTGHTKTRDADDANLGVMDLAVQGALRDQMPRWYDCILHIAEGKGGRVVMSQPVIVGGNRWLAKDRHRLLSDLADEKGIIQLPVDAAGFPSKDIAEAICG